MADTRLVDVANHMMGVLVGDLETAGIDVPVRRYIHSGEIAHDLAGANCAEQFAITWAGTFHGTPGLEAASSPLRCAVPTAGIYVIALLRCVPGVNARGQAPDDDALSASATEILTDAMTLTAVIVENALSGDLVPVTCSLVNLSEVVPFGPTGGVGGSTIQLTVSLV